MNMYDKQFIKINYKPSECIVGWDSCRAVFGAFGWVGIPKFIGGDEGV